MGKIYKWGILGPGKIAHKFASALLNLPNASLHAVGSRNIERAESFAKAYSIPKFYDNYEQLSEDGDIDIIYIATPHSEHYSNTLLCLNNGRNVLCEKAFTSNSWQLERLIRLANEKQLFLMEAVWTRFLPSIEKLLEIIHEGTIGDIKMIHADFGFMAPYNVNSRLFNPALAGGSLLDIGIYPLFLSLLLMGEPKEISSLAHIGQTGVDESLVIAMLYDNGAMASLSSSLMLHTTTRADIFGTLGRIGMEPRWFTTSGRLDVHKYSDQSVQKHTFNYTENGYEYEAMEVMKCLDLGKTESEKLPLSFSLKLMKCMDKIRKQIGVRYSADDEYTD